MLQDEAGEGFEDGVNNAEGTELEE